MNNIMTFSNSEFGDVRSLTIDNEPWFVAADVCRALEIGNSRMATDRLDDDEKDVSLIDTLGGPQNMVIINEPGLYTLILGSRKSGAKKFKRWITHDVIPAIRKTGSYSLATKRRDLSPTMQTLYLMLDEIAETQREVGKVKDTANLAIIKADNVQKDVDNIKTTIFTAIDSIKNSVNWRKEINRMNREIAAIRNVNYSDVWNGEYDELDARARCSVKSRLKNLIQRTGNIGKPKCCKLDVVERDPKLKEIFTIIVAENYARYCL